MQIFYPKHRKYGLSIFILALVALTAVLLNRAMTPKKTEPTTTERQVTASLPIGLPFANGFAQIPESKQTTYVIPNYLKPDTYALEGEWLFSESTATLTKAPGKLKVNFKGKKVYLSAGAKQETSIQINVDSESPQVLLVQKPDRYLIFDNPDTGEHVLEITVPNQGLEIYQFDFE